MAVQTPNFSFDLPDIGADSDAWGDFLNGNWSDLDTLLATFLPLAGGTMTGQITLPGAGTGLEAATVDDVDAVGGALTAHLADVANPHVVTAAQVSALALAGGTMTGQIILPGGATGLEAETADAVALKAPLASPTLTGTPLTPTAAQATNNTQIASTAFVKAGGGISLGAVIPTTSGTAHGRTGIPAGASRIIVSMNGLSLNGDDEFLIQIGDSGGYEVSGYFSAASVTTASTGATDGFILNRDPGAGSAAWYGIATLIHLGNNQWSCVCNMMNGTDKFVHSSAGRGPATMNVLDRVQVTRNGSNTFDGGAVSFHVE